MNNEKLLPNTTIVYTQSVNEGGLKYCPSCDTLRAVWKLREGNQKLITCCGTCQRLLETVNLTAIKDQ